MRRNKGDITICDTLVFVEISRRRLGFYGSRGVASGRLPVIYLKNLWKKGRDFLMSDFARHDAPQHGPRQHR